MTPPTDDTYPIGRLAFRVEGSEWVAYYALEETMEGSIRLASIKMKLVENIERKEEFMNLMRKAVSDLIEESTGRRPTWPHDPVTAPEHERAGQA